MNDDKVGMSTARAYREVVPDNSVLFEEVLEALCESQLAAAVEAREAQARDQECHVMIERLTASSEFNATSSPRVRPPPTCQRISVTPHSWFYFSGRREGTSARVLTSIARSLLMVLAALFLD